MKQIVAHKKLGNLRGILLVLALLVILIALNYVFSVYVARLVTYNIANVLFWAVGALIAWQLLRVYIASVIYTLEEDVLRIARKYGRKERVIEDIYLSRLCYVGSVEEAKKRYPQARRVNAVHPGVKDPRSAIVYQSSQGTRIALVQVNREIQAKLVERVKGK